MSSVQSSVHSHVDMALCMPWALSSVQTIWSKTASFLSPALPLPPRWPEPPSALSWMTATAFSLGSLCLLNPPLTSPTPSLPHPEARAFQLLRSCHPGLQTVPWLSMTFQSMSLMVALPHHCSDPSPPTLPAAQAAPANSSHTGFLTGPQIHHAWGASHT